MKYEIIRGSEKDFEGAPEWCTHVIISDASNKLAYESSDRAVKGNPWKWVGDEVVSKYGQFISGRAFTHIIAERRPITEPVWSGEGLPPVGVECEIKRVADWFPVTIKFISGYYTVILTRGGTEDAFQKSALQFRPIRSPEDVARDEVIANICFEIGVRPNNIVVQQTYDAIAAGKIPGITLSGK